MVVVLAGRLSATAGAQSSAQQPRPTDVGITATEIHIAVVADVDSPIVPNIFKGSVDAVKGVSRYLNANGGLAGRRVVVDFYDSKLNPTQTRNGEIQACQNDVAMVGTSSAFLTSVEDMRNCKDSTGATTGLPDIPFITTALVHGGSDQSFLIAAPAVVCRTTAALALLVILIAVFVHYPTPSHASDGSQNPPAAARVSPGRWPTARSPALTAPELPCCVAILCRALLVPRAERQSSGRVRRAGRGLGCPSRTRGIHD
jgi:hypothetical protein